MLQWESSSSSSKLNIKGIFLKSRKSKPNINSFIEKTIIESILLYLHVKFKIY